MSGQSTAPVSDWFDFMPDTVTIDAWVSQSVTGVPTYAGAPVTYAARIEMKNHIIIDSMGREALAKGRVFLGTATLPGLKDKITLPLGYVPRTPPMLAVNPVHDEVGIHHITVEIG